MVPNHINKPGNLEREREKEREKDVTKTLKDVNETIELKEEDISWRTLAYFFEVQSGGLHFLPR